MKRNLLLTAVVVLGSALSACAGHRAYVVVGPPPPRHGPVGFAPGPRHVWTEGYWDWRGGAWVWAPGRWMVPPRARAVWVPGHWTRQHRGYVFVAGRWR